MSINNSSVIKEKGESQKGGFKKTKQVKFSEKWTFLTPWYAHVFVFRKTWRVLFSWNTHFEIRPFKNSSSVLHNFLWVSSTVQKVQEKFQFQEKACMEGRMDIGTDPILKNLSGYCCRSNLYVLILPYKIGLLCFTLFLVSVLRG